MNAIEFNSQIHSGTTSHERDLIFRMIRDFIKLEEKEKQAFITAYLLPTIPAKDKEDFFKSLVSNNSSTPPFNLRNIVKMSSIPTQSTSGKSTETKTKSEKPEIVSLSKKTPFLVLESHTHKPSN